MFVHIKLFVDIFINYLYANLHASSSSVLCLNIAIKNKAKCKIRTIVMLELLVTGRKINMNVFLCLIMHLATNTYGELRYSSTYSWTQQ
jgi:hypothetical protein